MKSILDPTFHYIPAVQTDLRKTFERVRRERAQEAAEANERRLQAQDKARILANIRRVK